MELEQLSINDMSIPYEIQVSTKAKRVSIRICEGKVKVSVPKGISVKQVKTFVEAKKEWILKHWLAHKNIERNTQRSITDGSVLSYLGKDLVLHVHSYEGKRVKISCPGNALTIFLPDELPEKSQSVWVQKAVEAWYKEQARKILWDKLDYFANIMGVEYKQFRLKEQKTLWGSCSAQGNINLNWRVILAPEPIIDYLVIHELAHLRYLNHSKDFWHLVESYMPEYRNRRKWLKEHGRELYI